MQKRISLEILYDLVDFIQHNKRIGGLQTAVSSILPGNAHRFSDA
jgi:hypothetical protein